MSMLRIKTMGEVTDLFEYRGTCLDCGKSWMVTKEQLDVAVQAKMLYSPCCNMPATIMKRVAKKPT